MCKLRAGECPLGVTFSMPTASPGTWWHPVPSTSLIQVASKEGLSGKHPSPNTSPLLFIFFSPKLSLSQGLRAIPFVDAFAVVLDATHCSFGLTPAPAFLCCLAGTSHLVGDPGWWQVSLHFMAPCCSFARARSGLTGLLGHGTFIPGAGIFS